MSQQIKIKMAIIYFTLIRTEMGALYLVFNLYFYYNTIRHKLLVRETSKSKNGVQSPA